MTGCDADIDWGSNKQDVDNADDDVGFRKVMAMNCPLR